MTHDDTRRPVIRFAVRESSLGRVLVAESDAGVCAVLLGDDPEALRRELSARFGGHRLAGDSQQVDAVADAVLDAVESRSGSLGLPLHLEGTAFQQSVWQALRKIPPGETRTYGELARQLGRPRAARAVAQACGANRLAVVIPCHRAVAANGSLGGYRWGVERKRALLEREKRR